MKLSLQKAERAVEKASRTQQVQSNGPSNVDVSKELARLNRHRDALASILNDYDASTSRLTAAMTGRSIPSYGVSRETAPVQQQSFSAPVSQPRQSASSGVSTAKAVEVVLEVLANKTGYETDMLEMDMDLETELGVDSIKRVEILSDVQAELGIEAQDVAALGRTRTVGEVVEAMKAEILNAGGSAAVSSAPVQQQSFSAPVSQPRQSASSGVSTAKAVEVVLEVLANKTGYETDMLEMDMDLETELGVDSIKRVEILSDVQAELGIEAQDVAALGRTRTVGEVVEAMKAEILNAGGSAAVSSAPVQQQSFSAPVSQPRQSASSGVSTAKAVEVVLEVLANKTGYETDMLEMDMDLETELGVDSIKRVEILSDVQAELGIEAQDVAALGRTRTVGEVVEAMKAEILNAGGSAAVSSAPVQQQSFSAPVSQPRQSASSGVSTAKAVEVVLEVLANKTGYETDMLEMDMDLETELGVDSIKRVEILSDVQAELGIEAQDVAALGRTRTVGEVVEAMKAEILNAGGSAAVSSAPVQQQSFSAPVSQPRQSASSGVSTAKAVEVVLEVLANKTGYETDMLEMDMDLETELGVDSIKRVEILSDVQAELGIEAQDVAALGRTRTVGEVVEAMKAEILNAGGSAAVSSAPVQQQSFSAPVSQPRQSASVEYLQQKL